MSQASTRDYSSMSDDEKQRQRKAGQPGQGVVSQSGQGQAGHAGQGGQGGQGQSSERHGATGMIENATDKAKEIAHNVGEYAGQAKEKVSEWASTAGGKIKDVASHAGEYAMQARDTAGEAIQTVGTELTSVVRRYPLQSLMAGAAVGYLLGCALSRR